MKAVVVDSLLIIALIVGFCNCSIMFFVLHFLAVPQICLQFVIVVLPDHTHLLFLWFHDKGLSSNPVKTKMVP